MIELCGHICQICGGCPECCPGNHRSVTPMATKPWINQFRWRDRIDQTNSSLGDDGPGAVVVSFPTRRSEPDGPA